VAADDATNPQVGVDAAQRIVNVDGVVGIVGALSSGVTIPIATTVSATAGVPQISTASTSPVITTLEDNGFLFRTTPHDALQGEVLADVVSGQGIDKVAVVYVNNDYGKGLADAFAESYEGEVSASVAYEERQASYRGELSRAADGDPDALILLAYPGDGIPMLRQALEEGFFERFVFADGMKATEVAEAVGNALDGAFGTSPSGDPEAEAAKLFREIYEGRHGELPPQPFIDTAYDATMLMALAIEKAGSTEGAAIRDALHEVANPPGETILPGEFAKAKELLGAGQDVNYEGAGGSQDFDEAGDVPGTYSHWAIKDGGIVEVELIRPGKP
jgi:ABC-type branched-subunit amino acid transport system substrate-binding protein